MSTEADQRVARYILRQYRESAADNHRPGDPVKHLVECADVEVADADAEDGGYGCDTGCSYYTLRATLTCSHGHTEDYEYGNFGEIADIIDDMELDEATE